MVPDNKPAFAEKAQATLAAPPSRLAGFGQAMFGSGLVIAQLRLELDRARDHFRQGDYSAAQLVLEALTADFEALVEGSSRPTESDLRYYLPLASAHTLLGRTCGRLADERASHRHFSRAIALFEEWLPQTEDIAGRGHRDYGMALDRVGRADEALRALERAVLAGAGGADTLRYIAGLLERRGRVEDAERYLRGAVELATDRPEAYRALAENLELQNKQEEAVDILLRGALVATKDFDVAKSLVEQALRLDPTKSVALSAKAEMKRMEGDYVGALSLADNALAAAPDLAAALATKASAFQGLGRYREAKAAIARALEIAPEYSFAAATNAQLLAVGGDPLAALAVVEAALVSARTDAFLLATKGTVLVRLGRYDDAVSALDEALRWHPDSAFALVAKADAIRLKGDLRNALALLEQTLSRYPEDAAALGSKGETLRLLGRYSDSLASLDRALNQLPQYPFALTAKGFVLIELGRGQEAIVVLGDALDLDPDNAFALVAMADALTTNHQYDRALGLLERALEIAPDYILALTVEAETLRGLGRRLEAHHVVDCALERSPAHVSGLLVKGRLLWADGHRERAIATLQRAAEAAHGHPAVYGELAEAFRRMRRFDKALEVIEPALVASNRDAQLLRTKAYALADRGQGGRALQMVLAADPDGDDAVVQADVAYLQMRVDDYGGARQSLDRAVSIDAGDFWVLMIEGYYWYSIADYNRAIEYLERATRLNPTSAWAFAVKAWSLLTLAVELFLEGDPKDIAERAKEAFLKAIEADGGQLALHVGLGDSHRLLGDVTAATTSYEWVIAQCRQRRDELDADDLRTTGWCLYQLGEYREAVRLLIEAYTLDSNSLIGQFNLALVSLCNGQYAVALREYDRGILQASRTHPLGRRGVLRVALNDLLQAVPLRGEKVAELERRPEFVASPRPSLKRKLRKKDAVAEMMGAPQSLNEARDHNMILAKLEAALDDALRWSGEHWQPDDTFIESK